MSRRLSILLLPLALAACGSDPAKDVNALDSALVNGADGADDPALTAALADQIMVDPQLSQQSNARAARAADRPTEGGVPAGTEPREGSAPRPDRVTLGQMAAAQATGRCPKDVKYGFAWSTKLPPHTPLPRDARVAEAAGSDEAGCGLRVVSFATAQPPAKLAAWYAGLAKRAGYSFESQQRGAEQLLGGTKGENAYVITLVARPAGGTDVDLVSSVGR